MAITAEVEGVGTLEFPDGTDPSVIQKTVKRIASENKQTVGQYATGTANEALQGATFGFSDEIQSIIAAAIASPYVSDKTFSQLMVDARNSIREDQEGFREKNPKTAIAANIAGGVATGSGLFKGASTVGQMAAAGAGTGAVAGAGFSDSDEFVSTDTAIDTAIGAGGGALFGAAIGKVADDIRNITKRKDFNPFDQQGKFTDEAVDIVQGKVEQGAITQSEANTLYRNAEEAGGVLTPEQMRRYNLFKERGVTPTRANVTQSTDDFRMQQESTKRSGAVADTVTEQNRQITELASRGVDDIGAAAQNTAEANSSVFSVVTDRVTELDDVISKAYAAARKEAAGQPRVTLNSLMDSVASNRGKENVSGGIISAIRQSLKNKGLFKRGADIDINKRGTRPSGAQTKKLTVQEAEEIRQELNALWDSATPAGRRLIREFKNAIDDDVASVVGDDIFAEARKARSDFQKTIERASRDKFDKTKGSFLEDVIDNKIPEEKIIDKLKSKSTRVDDFIAFKNFLVNDAGESGAKAWNEIRADVLRSAIEKATSTQGKTEGGQAVFNARLFKNSLKSLRESRKFGEMFNADEIKLIDDIIEIGNLRVPISGTQSGEGPSARAVNAVYTKLVQRLPIIGDSAQGFIDDVMNARTDRYLLDVTKETAEALRGQ